VALSYTKSDADMKRGGAEMDAFGLAVYGTKFYDNGLFVDVIGRLAKADTDLTIDGQVKGSMDNLAVSLSGEAGWRFNMTERHYVEPQVEVTYTRVDNGSLQLDNGKTYEFDSVDSLIGRAGFAAGFTCPNKMGDVYVRASVVREFMGDAGIAVRNGKPIEVNGSDTWFEYGIGANFNVNKNTYVYADIERTSGAALDEDWRANVGVRYSF
jgi:outer membrane autotransporter protein